MRTPALPFSYKWFVLALTMAGIFMGAVDVTAVILAIPEMMADLHANLVSIVWVLMSYTFMTTVLLLAIGRVADLYGRTRLYNIGFALFTVASALCGLSGGPGQLIASRVLQGAGGALLLVNAWPILTEAFPPSERGAAIGINSMVFGLGSIVGPVMGGLIIKWANWRWIFYINIPVGVAGTVAGYLYLKELSKPPSGEKLDGVGALCFSAALFALLLALTRGNQAGWTSPSILALLGFFVVGLLFFLHWERRVPFPALDLGLFKNRLYNSSVASSALQSLAMYSVQFLVIYYLQAVRGNTPISAAFRFMPMPVAYALTAPFSGRVSDRLGARIPATAGLLLQSAGVYVLSTTGVLSGYGHITIGLILTGIGAGAFFSPNTNSAMGAADRNRLGVAAGALSTLRNMGMVVSYAAAMAVAAMSIPRDLMLSLFVGNTVRLGPGLSAAFIEGMDAALRVSLVICLCAAGLSCVRGRER
jgi:EmrB/QacA subfamily drug resistance transporter